MAAVPPRLMKMRDLLLRTRVVDELQMRSALAKIEQWGGRLPRTLAELGMVDEDQVTETVAEAMKLPVQMLGGVTPDAQAQGRLDVAFCEENAVFPVSYSTRTHTLTVAVADPTDLELADTIAARSGSRIQVVVSSEAQILAAIARVYRGAPVSVAHHPPRKPPGGGDILGEIELDHTPPPPTLRDPGHQVVFSRAPSANTLLDEMLGDEEPDAELTDDELARLEAVRTTQHKTNAILRALQALLAEKGRTR